MGNCAGNRAGQGFVALPGPTPLNTVSSVYCLYMLFIIGVASALIQKPFRLADAP